MSKQLLNILPENYEYIINGVSVREYSDISNEVKLEAEFRVNVENAEGLERFLLDFSKSSGTSYNKKNQADKSGKRTLLYGIRKCIHNVNRKDILSEYNKNQNKTGKIKEPGKHTNCSAELNFSISSHCESVCLTDTHLQRNLYPLEIKLYYNHNHAIQAADAMRFRPVSEETKKMLIDLFEEDVAPSAAYRRVIDYFETDAESLADRHNVPDYKWVYNFHAKYIKNKFGTANGPDVYMRLQNVIKGYNREKGKELAKVQQTATGETIIVICDEFNHRVHENIPAAGDLLIMDATANLDRNDTKLFHLMCPSPIGGLPLGTIITTKADEVTLCEALNLYKTLLTEKSFYGRGKDLGPTLIITDDDSAERNSLKYSWPQAFLLLCHFHLLNAVWSWLWKAEHKIERTDRPILLNLFKKVVYSESTEKFDKNIRNMQIDKTYKNYPNFIRHVESKILPRHKEWSLKERMENKLPTHNQNTTNYVEYSFRMTKDVQFSRLRAYNMTDLLGICLDDSRFYTRRCLDVSHNRNYHLFTNQKSKYLFKKSKLDENQVIQLSSSEFIVPSESESDKRYRINMKKGLCECKIGALKGPCKHKALVAKMFKTKNFEILPEDNSVMRAFFYFLATGSNKDASWFRPIEEEEILMPEVDWSMNNDEIDDHETGSELDIDNVMGTSMNMEMDIDPEECDTEDMDALSSFKTSIFDLFMKVEENYENDKSNYKNAIKAFIKQEKKLHTNSAIQKALHIFAKDVVNIIKKGRKKNSGSIPVQNTAKSRRQIKHRGSGPSQMGRPTKEQNLRVQLIVNEEEDLVAHSFPRSRKNPKHPHSLAEAVANNRPGEKKH